MDVKRGPIEVALSTDLRGAPYTFSLWDIHTGAQLVVFRGNKTSLISNCLHLIDSNYFITAADNVLQIWSIYNRKCQDQKLFLPSRPSSLCVSPCGKYLIVGISEMIYVWQFSSGNLLAHTQRHYQTVTVLRMNHKGTFLFSGGEDGMVLVWPFTDLISGTHNTGALGRNKSNTDTGINEPRFTWQHHSANITDIHVTSSDCNLCITTSTDKAVNIYSYSDGKRLHCIADWPTPLWCAVMDRNCHRIFFGGQDGNIYELAISSLGVLLMESRDKDDDGVRKPTFTGHKDRIDRLLLSMDGSLLVSGSHDSTCKIWDIPSGKMVRDVKHQAPLANLTSLFVPDAFSLTSMTQSSSKPPYLIKPLKRNLHKLSREISLTAVDLFEESSTTIVTKRRQLSTTFNLQKNAPVAANIIKNTSSRVENANGMSSDTKLEPIDDNEDGNIRTRLRELYLLSAEKLFKDAAAESLEPYKQLITEIDATLPIATKAKTKRKQSKRKDTTSDNESGKPELTAVKSQTNGVKKIKSVDDIFV